MIVRQLKVTRILVVGDHPTGFDACNYRADELRQRFGVETVTTPVSQFLDSVKALPDAVADAPYARRARDFANLGEMDAVATRKTLKAYVALKDRAETEGFAGVAVRCWPEFFTEYGCAACGAIALLNEDGRPGGCEADVFGVISSLVLQSASGRGVFNTDLVDVDPVSDTVVFWHCGQAPIEMADPEVAPRATIHSNRKLPLLSEFPLKPGRITLCRITQGEGRLRMMLSGGEMLRAPLAFSGTSGVAPAAVADSIRADTRLVTIMLANNEIGVLQPLAEIGAVCRQRGVLLHTDATQAVGKVPVDVQQLQVDLLSFSAQRAATPATCGVAMLVPFIDLSPPPAFAEITFTPGPETSAPVLEKRATSRPCAPSPSAATEMTPSATAGGDTAISHVGLSLSFPAAATRIVG